MGAHECELGDECAARFLPDVAQPLIMEQGEARQPVCGTVRISLRESPVRGYREVGVVIQLAAGV